MSINQLELTSHKNNKRVGRGISAGQGKTAGRGTKGQKARTGKKLRAGFEGGQNPLMMRLPKLPGFTSHRPTTQNVYTGQLNNLKGSSAGNAELAEAGLINDQYSKTKLIVKGEVTKAIKLEVQAASVQAIAQVKKAGGEVTIVARPQRAITSTKKSATKAD